MFRIKSPRDLGAGIFFIVIGIGGFWFGRNLATGTASRMGPGYFPMMLSGLIMFVGAIVLARSFVLEGPPIQRPQVRPLLFVVLSMLTFGYLIPRVGLLIAVVAMIGIAALGRRERINPVETAALAIGMAIFAAAVFIYGLKQPLPLTWDR